MDQALKHRPIDIAVDFSRQGEYAAKFEHTYSHSHFKTVGLLVPEEVVESMPPAKLLAGLEATFEIAAPDGASAVGPTRMATCRGSQRTDGFVPLSDFSLLHFGVGEYGIIVKVLTGAQALRGVDQRLQAHQRLCELESVRVALTALSGIGLLLGAGVIGIIVLLVTVRRARQTASQRARPPDAAEPRR